MAQLEERRGPGQAGNPLKNLFFALTFFSSPYDWRYVSAVSATTLSIFGLREAPSRHK